MSKTQIMKLIETYVVGGVRAVEVVVANKTIEERKQAAALLRSVANILSREL